LESDKADKTENITRVFLPYFVPEIIVVVVVRGGTTGMATMAMAIALFGMLWPLMALAITLFCITCCLPKPEYLTRLLLRLHDFNNLFKD